MNSPTQLETVFETGQTVPEDGNYLLVDDDTKPDWSRTNLGRVIVLLKGNVFPAHPDTGKDAEWQFVRVMSTAGRYHPVQE